MSRYVFYFLVIVLTFAGRQGHAMQVGQVANAIYYDAGRDAKQNQAPAKKPVEPMAVVALVSGIFGLLLVPVAIVTSYIALRRASKHSRRGYNAANIGRLLRWIFLVPFSILMIILATR